MKLLSAIMLPLASAAPIQKNDVIICVLQKTYTAGCQHAGKPLHQCEALGQIYLAAHGNPVPENCEAMVGDMTEPHL